MKLFLKNVSMIPAIAIGLGLTSCSKTNNFPDAPASPPELPKTSGIILAPELTLQDLPLPITSIQETSVTVVGKNLAGYRYGISDSTTCDRVKLSELKKFDQPIKEYIVNGVHTLCVKGVQDTGVEAEFKTHTWEVDITFPTVRFSVEPPSLNSSGYLSAQLQSQNAVHYKYKVEVGTLTTEQCGSENYSTLYKIDQPIVKQMQNDGDHSLCIIGVSRTGVEQLFPTVFNFLQDARLPSVNVTLDSGDPLPSSVDGKELRIKFASVNLSRDFSYQLVAGSACPAITDANYSAPQNYPSSNEFITLLTQAQLSANIDPTTLRGLKTLCVISSKPGQAGSVRKNLEYFPLYVDTNTFMINEKNVIGLPANPDVSATYTLTITPPAAFNAINGYMYYKIERVPARTGLPECNFTAGAAPVPRVAFANKIQLDQIVEKGWWRFCLKIENSAGTQSNAASVLWFKETIVGTAKTIPANNISVIRLNQAQAGTTLNQVVTVTSAMADPTSTYEFKFKYFVGSKRCEDDNSSISGSFPIATNLMKNPLSKLTGMQTICIYGVQKSATGVIIAEQSEPSRYEWFHDETAPSLELRDLPVNSSNATAVTFRADARAGAVYNANSDAVSLSIANTVLKGPSVTCPAKSMTADYTKTTFPTNGVLTKTITLPVASTDDGTILTVCMFATDKSSNTTDIKKISWVYRIASPFAVLLLNADIKDGTRSRVTSTKLTIQTAGTKIVSYKSALITGTSCAGAVYSAAKTIDPAVPETISIAGPDGPRVLCVIAADSDGYEQSTTNPSMLSWVRDTTAPKFTLQGTSAATVTAASQTVNISLLPIVGGENAVAFDYELIKGSATATCPAAAAGVYSPRKASTTKLNDTLQVVPNPLILTTNVAAGASENFTLCVRGYDEAGNVSGTPVVSKWTQTAPP